ncbi:hypothetical protein [Pararhodospirillum photometricum]|uniref:Uncharacterized protein n=1 Tax=Pararhodospirillum photometricum DSM 122 TaxID=1150469 RepID=H6SRX0_PARPM|nr:hypothetical protein [Pararhodospirillum photometricum]CCG07649.1 Putative uncharacterized protein [Pararhodospirillum photometricum DSM 122]
MPEALYFAWVAPGTPFDAAQHARTDEAIRALEIRAEEGEAPYARVVVARRSSRIGGPDGLVHAYLSTRVDGAVMPLFFGVLTQLPDGLTGPFLTLQLDARTGDTEALTAAALAPYKVAPAYDALFISEGREDEPDEILEGWFARLCVDRLTGGVLVSHALEGRRTLTFGPESLAEGSLTLSQPDGPPPAWIEGRMVTTWTQRGGALADFGALIAREAGGALVTLSPEADFADGWPRVGQRLGGETGYLITESALVAQDLPAFESNLTDDPSAVTSEDGRVLVVGTGSGISLDGVVDFGPTAARSSLFPAGLFAGWISFAKSAYWPVLRVRWDFRQKRRETVVCRLTSHLAPGAPPAQGGEQISFGLRDVGVCDAAEDESDSTVPDCDSLLSLSRARVSLQASADVSTPSGLDEVRSGEAETGLPIGDPLYPSFALTSRGRQAVAHLLRVLAVRLAFAQRCVSVRARLPGWTAAALSLDLDCSVVLHSPVLPEGQVRGKVVSLRLAWDEDGCSVELVLAGSLGGGGTFLRPAAGADTVAEAAWDDYALSAETIHALGVSDDDPFAIPFYDFSAQQPTDALASVAKWTAGDLLQRLCLRNLWAEQDAYIWARRHGTVSPRALLSQVPTDVCLALRPLRGLDRVEHTVHVTPAGAFGLVPTLSLGAS